MSHLGAKQRTFGLRKGIIHIKLAKKNASRRAPKHAPFSLERFNAFISTPKYKNYEEFAKKHPLLRRRLVAIKDNIATKRYPTTCGSGILQQYQSPFEATAVKWLRGSENQSKAESKEVNQKVVMGKTNMDEFGMGSHSTHSFFGPVLGVRPLRKHTVGGSSGGSAVAVATGQCNTALGTDTGGSVRLPAAYTGVVGFKPSYGLISRWGVVPYANSLDTVGVLAGDAVSIWSAIPKMFSHDHRDPTSISNESRSRMRRRRQRLAIQSSRENHQSTLNIAQSYLEHDFSRLKIGIPLEYNIDELDADVREEWQKALQLFQEQGCTLVPISLPNTKHALSAYYVIAAAEAASNLSKYDGVRYGTRAACSDGAGDVLYSNTRGRGFGDEVKRRILLGSYSLSSKAIDNYFIKAQKVRRLVQRDFDRVFSLPNPLRDEEQFDLSEMNESVQMENKLGPPQVDFIVCPTAPTLPPTLDMVRKQPSVNSYMNDVFTVPSSLAGLPAINIPFKLQTKPGFAGIQLIGQFSDDFRLLVTAGAVELLQKGRFPRIRKQESSKTIVFRQESALVRNIPFKTDEKSRITKYPSGKGDNRFREPRTAKEIRQSFEESFEDWASMMSGR